jgi:hypothetical protein
MNLAANNIYMRPPREACPRHIDALVEQVQRQRDSPEPTLDQIWEDPDLAALQWIGAGEPQVEEYFRSKIFPFPTITENLRRYDRQPMAKYTVPSTGKQYKVSTPVPDMLYGHSQ